MVVKTAFGHTECKFGFRIDDVGTAKEIIGHHVDALVAKAELSHRRFDAVASSSIEHSRWKNEKTLKELNLKIGEAVQDGCDVSRETIKSLAATKFEIEN